MDHILQRPQWYFAIFACLASSATGLVDCSVDHSSVSPQGVHLAYAGEAQHNIAVSFFTCAAGGDPFVQLSEPGVPSNKTFYGVTSQYYERQHHDILMADLSPGTEYVYHVGLKGHDSRGPFRFRTAPQATSEVQTFTAAVIGDMGVNESQWTIERLKDRMEHFNFTLHLGDISYADDWSLPFNIEPSSGRSYEAVYDMFQDAVEPFASAMPYMVTPGNHEVSCHATYSFGCPQEQRNFTAYRYRFRMPCAESDVVPTPSGKKNSHHNMWYSWRVGNVHFVSISSETDFPDSPVTPHTILGGGAGGGFGDQLAWLRADLAAARKDTTVGWIVAMGHRPWYGSSSTDWPLFAPRHVKAAFEPIFHEFGVDLYLCGHKHYYERTEPAYDGKVDPHGLVQIINGAAGQNEGINKGKGIGEGFVVAANYNATGYGELSVNSTSLRWRYFLSESGQVFDELVLQKRERFTWEADYFI